MPAPLRRTLVALAGLALTAGIVIAAPAAATAKPASATAKPAAATAKPAAATAPATSPRSVTLQPGVATSTAVVPCSNISQIGDKRVVSDLGMQAFTVRQFIGWCSDTRGSAWMNFSSVYVWDQYHKRGFAYRVNSGVVVRGEFDARGFSTSANRQQTSYSTPVRTTQLCTQGWGKIFRLGSESAQGLTSVVC